MAGKEKRRYINYRVDAYLRDRFLQSGRKHKSREFCGGGEGLIRCFNHIKFCIVCCVSLSQAVAPWMLCASEVLTVLLIYFLATSRSLVIHHHRFSFTRSLEDVVGLSCTRAAILSIAYAIGQRSIHRPYLYTAYFLAAACLPYIVVKSILFRYGFDGMAAATILVLAGMCSIGHVLAARGTVEWARRRYQMGLAGFGMPWEEGEDAWMMLRRPDLEDMTKTSDGGGPDAGEDVPAEMLADDDSKFVELSPGLKIHYKEVAPPALAPAGAAAAAGGAAGPDGASTGIILVHGFGGGVFSWRNIMEKLAMQCQCRVIAFDRPAFGLTSRPKATDHSNPYTVASQSQLLLQFCSALGLRHIVLVAHADGCLVTLRAAAASASHHHHQRLPYMQPPASAVLPPVGAPRYAEFATLPTVERSWTAPASAEASPKLSSSPDLPATEVQAAIEGGLQAQQLLGSSGGGAPPSSTSAVSAITGDGAVTGGGSAQPSVAGANGTGALDREGSRSGVAPEELARAGSLGLHGGLGSGLLPVKGLSLAGAPPHHHVHHASHSCCVRGSGYTPLEGLAGDLEQGAVRLEADPDCASTSSLKPTHSSQAHHRRAQSVPGPVGTGTCSSARTSEVASCSNSPYHRPTVPYVLGLVLLHPNLSGLVGPAFSRILGRSKLGRSILRPLLRTEVGEIANRRAWHNTDRLTSEVLELYKTPLRVEGWDAALIETTRQRREDCQGDLASYCERVQFTPTLIATGEHDRIIPPGKSEALRADLPHARRAVLEGCGHLSHEEAPGLLLEHLVPFCGHALSQHHIAPLSHSSP